jgi:hypothetical protein
VAGGSGWRFGEGEVEKKENWPGVTGGGGSGDVGVEGVSGRSEERGCELTGLRCMRRARVCVEHDPEVTIAPDPLRQRLIRLAEVDLGNYSV